MALPHGEVGWPVCDCVVPDHTHLLMKLKLTTQPPLNLKWIRPIDKVGNSLKHKCSNSIEIKDHA